VQNQPPDASRPAGAPRGRGVEGMAGFRGLGLACGVPGTAGGHEHGRGATRAVAGIRGGHRGGHRGLDNMAKAFLDCMTDLGFWQDDAQITSLILEKFWARKPGIWVRVETL